MKARQLVASVLVLMGPIRPTAAVPPPADPPSVSTLIDRLDDDDAAVRDAASAGLMAAGAAVRSRLVGVAEHGDSPEARSRAAGILASLEAVGTTPRTRVTLHLDHADPAAVFDALARQANVKVDVIPRDGWPLRGSTPPAITVDLVNRPFWEAADEVCRAARCRVDRPDLLLPDLSPPSSQGRII